ncbi:hypothetical protein B0H14DRAFT_3046375 [Mycena olivaceomarginata]|nr:hypothetical protein B0H14DRAFT_3046375 [Mycena olivaceomarginata]
MGSGRREGRTHTGRARESSRVVLWASETRGRTAEPKLCSVSGGQEAVACAGSQRFAHAESARVCVACIDLEVVVCGWSRKGEEGEGSREKERGTRDKGRGTRATSHDEEVRSREGGERRGGESSCVPGAIRDKIRAAWSAGQAAPRRSMGQQSRAARRPLA